MESLCTPQDLTRADTHAFTDLVDKLGGDMGDVTEILHDLVHDLAWFQPDPKLRVQDGSLFGSDKAAEMIKDALAAIDEAIKNSGHPLTA